MGDVLRAKLDLATRRVRRGIRRVEQLSNVRVVAILDNDDAGGRGGRAAFVQKEDDDDLTSPKALAIFPVRSPNVMLVAKISSTFRRA